MSSSDLHSEQARVHVNKLWDMQNNDDLSNFKQYCFLDLALTKGHLFLPRFITFVNLGSVTDLVGGTMQPHTKAPTKKNIPESSYSSIFKKVKILTLNGIASVVYTHQPAVFLKKYGFDQRYAILWKP